MDIFNNEKFWWGFLLTIFFSAIFGYIPYVLLSVTIGKEWLSISVGVLFAVVGSLIAIKIYEKRFPNKQS